MKLSEAIVLGDTLKTRNPTKWLDEDGSCGCALGGALLAVGMSAERPRDIGKELNTRWPWLSVHEISVISTAFTDVCQGRLSLEALVDYVRLIEPKEEVTAEQPELECRVEVEK